MTLPASIWEQAGIVALFVVGFIALLVVLVKLMVQLVKLAIELITVFKGIITDTNSGFQQFIKERDIGWQGYLKELRESDKEEQRLQAEAFAARNVQVVVALNNLSDRIQAQASFDQQHHMAMTSAIDDMRRTVERKTRPISKEDNG